MGALQKYLLTSKDVPTRCSSEKRGIGDPIPLFEPSNSMSKRAIFDEVVSPYIRDIRIFIMLEISSYFGISKDIFRIELYNNLAYEAHFWLGYKFTECVFCLQKT